MLETEVKIAIQNEKKLKRLLSTLDGLVETNRCLEDDILYDFTDQRLLLWGFILRTREKHFLGRDFGEGITEYIITWKGPVKEKHADLKIMEEIEFPVETKELMIKFVRSMGLEKIFRYQKYRTLYTLSRVKILVDETPMGFYMELEGNPDSIHKIASKLGFSKEEYITENYYQLWQEYRKKLSIKSFDMVFDSRDGRLE